MSTGAETYLVTCPACGVVNRVAATREGKVGRCGNCQDILPVLYFRPQLLTDRTFNDFVKSYPGPILAEFWAPW